MNSNQTSRNRLRLTAERFGNSRSFHSITSTSQFILDILAWVLAVTIALVMRSYLQAAPDIGKIVKDSLIRVLPMVSLVQAVTGYIVGIYRRRWRYGSFDEVKGLILSALITTIILWVIRFFDTSVDAFPRSAIIAGGILGLFFTAASRYSWRLIREQLRRPSAQNSTKLLIYGAGEGGIQIVNTMLRNPSSQYLPVAFLDDNPKTHRLRISGVPVLGGRNEIAKIAQRTGASAILIAIPSADSTVVNEIVEIARDSKLNVKILPVVQSLDDRQVDAADIRDLTDEDLLGRRRVKIDLDEISQYLVNRRVLVTGAGGSIGSELCRQLVRFNPSEIIMLDRDESALHEVQLSIYGRALLDTPQTVLADLRDERAINEIFDSRKPQVVFHAAALKHLPLLERYPHEAYQTNVLGTTTVLNAAQRTGVEVFVNISTDKAANPISVLGFSKKIAERLTADLASRTKQGKYISVRFGNVLGSRGSVLMSFRDQIAKGGPVTVTHRGVTRYFMTISEAVQLVVQAGAIGRTGEVLVLDMGKPVNIYDVAEQLVKNSGNPIKIEVVGLRVGEKVHEELFAEGETDERPRHPLISHVAAKPIDQASLTKNPNDSRELMIKLAQE
jgi:FlaA1/EpsC-like NDP-sugar epimerase